MEAIKQIVRVSKNHEIKVKVPSYISENEVVEMILIIKKKPDRFKQKIRKLKGAMKDKLFLNDLTDISEDFKIVDLQRWE
jgi:metal-responsive CopG/Arc/MetJ family transcriptional regulator